MKNYRLKTIAVISILLVIGLTFLRENVFVEINAIIAGHDYNKAYFHVFDETISSLSLKEIQQLKWGLTIIFILIISMLTVISIYFWFKVKNYTVLTLKAYAVVLSGVVLLTLILWFLGAFTSYYFVVRKMIGFLQTPLPLFLLFSVFTYTNRK